MWPCSVACLSWWHGIVSHSQPPLMLCLVFICRSFISWHPMQLQRQHYSLQTSWRSRSGSVTQKSKVYLANGLALFDQIHILLCSEAVYWFLFPGWQCEPGWLSSPSLWAEPDVFLLTCDRSYSLQVYQFGICSLHTYTCMGLNDPLTDQLLTASMSIVGHQVPSRL